MTTKNKVLIFLAALSLWPVSASAISVTTTDSTSAFIDMLTGGGTNGLVITSLTYTGASTASGTFTDGTSSWTDSSGNIVNDMESGIVLTTGSASYADSNTNTSEGTSSSTENLTSGDAQLNQILVTDYWNNYINPTKNTTWDAASIEITFTSTSDINVTFLYLLASELNISTEEGNDLYGVFLYDSDTGTYSNISSPNIATRFTEVRDGSSSEYYDNSYHDDGTASEYDFEYDMFTAIQSYTFWNVTAGSTYTIKFVIADGWSADSDSAMFLSVVTTPTPEPATLLLFGAGLSGVLGLRTRRKKNH